jgi:4-carboxymuconolactone decarboxylase
VDDRERYDRGMGVRRAVLGDEHVEPSLQRRTAFNEEFQDLITRYAWGEVWTRSGLSRHTRSCMTLCMMLALGHWDEFEMHVRAALNNGLTREEIKEVLLQAAVYCGVPAANHGFARAQEVFAALDREATPESLGSRS